MVLNQGVSTQNELFLAFVSKPAENWLMHQTNKLTHVGVNPDRVKIAFGTSWWVISLPSFSPCWEPKFDQKPLFSGELDVPDNCSWRMAGHVPSPLAISLISKVFSCQVWALSYWKAVPDQTSPVWGLSQKKALCHLAHTSQQCIIFHSACYRTPKS